MQQASFSTQVVVVSLGAIIITVAVYGLVVIIVNRDAAGLYLLAKGGAGDKLQHLAGSALLSLAAQLMKSLTYRGTVAMF